MCYFMHFPTTPQSKLCALTLAGPALNAACSEGVAVATHSLNQGVESCHCWSQTGRRGLCYSGSTLCANTYEKEEEDSHYSLFNEVKKRQSWSSGKSCCDMNVFKSLGGTISPSAVRLLYNTHLHTEKKSLVYTMQSLKINLDLMGHFACNAKLYTLHKITLCLQTHWATYRYHKK